MGVAEIAIVAIFLVPIIGIVGHYCHLTIKDWQQTALKRDMVARGYTANEIAAVVSGKPAAQALGDVPPAKPIRQPA